jgi:hypothetical protein
MSVFQRDFLARVKSRGVPTKPQQSVNQSENGENGAEQQNSTEELVRKARAAGPLIFGPCVRSRVKGSWRDDAKWLEDNFPEEFGEPPLGRTSPITEQSREPSCGTGSSIKCSNSEPANEPTTGKLQPFANAPESPESALAALSAPSPIPLASAFWQSLLFGNPDALVPSSDATRAIALVSDKLGVVLIVETIDSMRAGQLRKMLGERFGPNVWDVMNKLWRSAPATPGAPTPAADQSQLAPGPLPADRRWIRDLHDPDRIEREWLLDHGIGL